MSYFNAGILLFNVAGMKEKCSQIFSMMEKGIASDNGLFDQGYLNKFCFNDMTFLPLEYNWKPYWGINNNARIIHFHGMKPFGNNKNSGFAMNESALIATLSDHVKDINGYIFYLDIFFELIGKDGKNGWLNL